MDTAWTQVARAPTAAPPSLAKRTLARGMSALLAGLVACAHGTANAPFTPLSAEEAAAVLPLPRPPQQNVACYVADGRVTQYAAGRRSRADLRLLVARPDKFRLTVLSPQGTALAVAASDGQKLTGLDVASGERRQAAATAEGLAALLPGLSLKLPPSLWVGLLFGDLAPPPGAEWQVGAALLRASWQEGNQHWQADYDRASGQLQHLVGAWSRASGLPPGAATQTEFGQGVAHGAALVTSLQAHLGARHSSGLPTELRLTLQGPAFADAEGDGQNQLLQVVLGHFNLQPEVAAQAYEVRP